MKTLILIAHDQLDQSSSHQFLLTTGQSITSADYVDLQSEYNNTGSFDSQKELDRLENYDRIIFQFQLFWYQAPAILKIWLDQVFSRNLDLESAGNKLADKEFGLVVLSGSKESHYQKGGQHQVTFSELVSPYYAFAHYFNMKYLKPFTLSQFQYMTEEEKFELMIEYSFYLEKGMVDSFTFMQGYMEELLEEYVPSRLELDEVDQIIFQQFSATFQTQADELNELNQLLKWD